MSVMRSIISGCGHYLPEKTLSNDDLTKMVETSDEWITERTGIKQRHIAKDDEYTSDLAFNAAKMALKNAKIEASDIDLIIIGTTTPDNTCPSTATKVQAMLGMKKGSIAFDIQAACSGFIYSMTIADSMIKTGLAKNALVIGAETLSRIVDWKDRNTCVLFGDGAGAMVLGSKKQSGTTEDEGILKTNIHADGYEYDSLVTSGGPSTTQTTGYLTMNGKEVFRHAVVNLTKTAKETIQQTGLTTQDIDWLVPHQANLRIIEGTAKKLGISKENVVITVNNHANTSTASIPLAVSHAVQDGRIKKGQLVVMDAMGAGFTWGSAIVRF